MAECQRECIDAEISEQNSSLKTNAVTKAKRQSYSVQKAAENTALHFCCFVLRTGSSAPQDAPGASAVPLLCRTEGRVKTGIALLRR